MPSFTQKRHFEAGYLGRKSGKGFYSYENGTTRPEPNEDEILGKEIFTRVLAMLINEASDALHYGISSAAEIDLAMTKGVNYPKGLLKWADEIGIESIVNQLDDLFASYHDPRYRCSVLLRKMVNEERTFF
jgi:3-hydroxybutyryl-CoA dehydrogenase